MRKIKYYCDCCGKEVNGEEELNNIHVVFNMDDVCNEKEVCLKCLHNYYMELSKIANRMFNK